MFISSTFLFFRTGALSPVSGEHAQCLYTEFSMNHRVVYSFRSITTLAFPCRLGADSISHACNATVAPKEGVPSFHSICDKPSVFAAFDALLEMMS